MPGIASASASCQTGRLRWSCRLRVIAKIERTHLRQPVRFYTGLELSKRLRDRKLHSLLEIYAEHFGITMVPDRKPRNPRAETAPSEAAYAAAGG